MHPYEVSSDRKIDIQLNQASDIPLEASQDAFTKLLNLIEARLSMKSTANISPTLLRMVTVALWEVPGLGSGRPGLELEFFQVTR